MTTDTPDLMIPADTAELEALQRQRRRLAFAHALKAPFHANRLGDIDADNVDRDEEWARIPILDKEQLRGLDTESFYNDFCLAPRRAVAEYWRSGGSTGRPLFYPRTHRDLAYGMTGFMRVLDLAGFSADDIAHMSLPLGIHPAGHLMARSGSRIGIGMVWAGGGNTLPSSAQLDLMRQFQPTAWIGMASYGIQLANLARSEGFDLAATPVDKVLCTAEPLSASKRAKLTELFGAQVRDCFGMTEMMMLGGEDGSQAGFRFWSDFCYPEVLDENTLEPVAEGEPGLLVVTSLVTNEATPFIRWNTGDIVTMRSGTAAGSPYDVFPLVAHTHRTAGFVKVRGVNIGFTDFEDLMFSTPEIADFRVEIVAEEGRDELDLHVEFGDGAEPALAGEKLSMAVHRTFEVKPRIRRASAGEIARAFEGSFKPPRFADLRG